MLRRLAADAHANGRPISVDSFSGSAAGLEQQAETLPRFICGSAAGADEPSSPRVPG